MPEKWTGGLVGKMHNHRIGYDELAQELNVSKPYVSMVLNGARNPKDAKKNFTAAVEKIIARRKEEQDADTH